MQTNQAPPATIDEYIEGFPPAVQDDLRAIRAVVRQAAPEAEEAIKYGMPTYVLHGNLVYFAAFKKHIGFFGTSLQMGGGALADELAPYAGPKGSLQFAHGKPVPLDLIRRIVAIRIDENLSRKAESAGKKRRG